MTQVGWCGAKNDRLTTSRYFIRSFASFAVSTALIKIFERLMYNRLIIFLDKYNILYQNQFGFRQGHSTHYALIALVDKITKSLDNRDIVIGIFLDLKKHLIQLITKSSQKIIPLWYSRKFI